MIRAIYFDFYSVWAPDRFEEYLNYAQALGEQEHALLADLVQKYYLGEVELNYLVEVFKNKLGRADIDMASLTLTVSDISPKIVILMQDLHGHFLKLGILANLGKMELGLLQQFNASQPLFEVILSPYAMGLKKPLINKQVFNKAIHAIGEQPSQCLVVSGHEDYLKFASRNGMQTIKYVGFEQLLQSLQDLLSKEMPSFVLPMQ